MKCEILKTTKDGQKVICTLTLEGDSVIADGDSADLETSLLTKKHRVGGKLIGATDDPKAWFEALPATYSGDYLRARMVASNSDFASILDTARDYTTLL